MALSTPLLLLIMSMNVYIELTAQNINKEHVAREIRNKRDFGVIHSIL